MQILWNTNLNLEVFKNEICIVLTQNAGGAQERSERQPQKCRDAESRWPSQQPSAPSHHQSANKPPVGSSCTFQGRQKKRAGGDVPNQGIPAAKNPRIAQVLLKTAFLQNSIWLMFAKFEIKISTPKFQTPNQILNSISEFYNLKQLISRNIPL